MRHPPSAEALPPDEETYPQRMRALARTGQGLLNYFLRGVGGPITEDEARATGLTLGELQTRSVLKILQARRAGQGA